MSHSDTEEHFTSESESDDEETVEDEEEAVVIVKPKRKGRTPANSKAAKSDLNQQPKTIVKRKRAPAKKGSCTSTVVKKTKIEDVMMDLSEPDKSDQVIPEFCCKIGSDWIVRAVQFSTHGSPYLQIQKVDDKMRKVFGVQMPLEKQQKLVKAIQEAAKHCAKHK